MTATAAWPLWTTTMQVTVVDPAELPAARALAQRTLAAVERACSHHREDAELALARPRQAEGVPVSPLLARLLEDALEAARRTDGLLDPALGDRLEEIGLVPAPAGTGGANAAGTRLVSARRATWSDVTLREGRLTAAPGIRFDLGATGKASAADLAVERLAEEPRVRHGVLVSFGGDLATWGEGPEGGWQIDVADGPDQPSQRIRLEDGAALATSSTLHRRVRHRDLEVHHILDPRTGEPAVPALRTATVAAGRCLEANTWSTAAIVLGADAAAHLDARGVTARLVDRDGEVTALGSWPAVQEVRHG